MQKYFKDPKTGKVIVFDILGLAQLGKLQREGFREALPQERIDYITRKSADDAQKLLEERQKAERAKLANVYYMAPHKNDDGYGQSSRNIKTLIENHGIYLDPEHSTQKVGLCYHLPNTLALVHTPVKIAFTMFETNKYPPFWEPHLKSADHVLVPTQFCADVMYQNFGIMPEVVPLGYHAPSFQYIERTQQEVFTFLHYDAFKWRKGWDILFRAFNEEFGEGLDEGTKDVRLIFKTTLTIAPPLQEYPKVSIIKGRIPQEEFYDLMKRSDCFVFPTRGEGFGLTPLEAMATGMRVIVPNHTGITHYFKPEYCYDLPYAPIRAKYDNVELWNLQLGDLLEPTVQGLRVAMRQAYNDWKAGTYYNNSMEIAEYTKQFTIDKTAERLAEVLKSFL